ncbi:hypothetical protein BJY52DRAFT_1420066 [Lactarius psammicola]|nr:hypothetical protein BJY52DRAFT_1420066 [Lactarius psammicola]
MSFKLFSPRSRLAISDNHPPARPDTITSASARLIGMRNDVAMGTVQTSLAALKEGSALAARLPYIAPIAGLLLQPLTMRDARLTHFLLTEVKQCKEECNSVMRKFARVASIIVNAELALDTRLALIAGRREVAADFGLVSDVPARLGPKAAVALAFSRVGLSQSSHSRLGSGRTWPEPWLLVDRVEVEWIHHRRRRRRSGSGGAKANARESERDSTRTRTVAIRGGETTTRRRRAS